MKLKAVTIFVLLVMLVGCLGLALSYAATIAYAADDGYPAPELYPVGYPVDYGYPVDMGYPMGYPEPIDYGYPVFEPVPTPDYPEPEASSPEIEVYNNPVQLEPIKPQYRNGRNLWQEILFQFAKLLELMK